MPSPQSMESGASKNNQTEKDRWQSDGPHSETIETVSSRPWSSGRTLTAAQRARKRAVDNQSHRERRNRTQSRIAELEAKLEALLEDKIDKRGANTTIEEASHEAESQRLEPMSDLISASSNMEGCVGPGTWTFPSPSDLTTIHSPGYIDCSLSEYNSIINGASALDTSQTVLAAPELLLPSNVGQPFPRISAARDLGTGPSTISSVAFQTTDQCESISTTQHCNMELSKVSHLTSNQVCRDELVNQDFIIRAVLQGWETVECRGRFCPLWEMLHRIDDLIFCTSSNITRLVMLYTVHRMLLVSRLNFWEHIRPITHRIYSVMRKRRHLKNYRPGIDLGKFCRGHPSPTSCLRILGRRSANFNTRLSWVTSPGKLNAL
jgi:hypothetical protein